MEWGLRKTEEIRFDMVINIWSLWLEFITGLLGVI